MVLLNSESASDYIDEIPCERRKSAVLAIHLAWLNHSSPLARAERIEPRAPLDLLLLYQAAAATFETWPPPASPRQNLAPGARVLRQQEALERLNAVSDEERRRLASIFAGYVVALSVNATSPPDLDYHVELFLKCIADNRMIEDIASGAVSKHSDRLSDPDLW